jgi:DNA-directed RNA polymerase subunit omega
MARVTIEDCIERIPSRFELVVLAAQRAKEISSGSKPLIDRDNDKDAVIALREIAVGLLEPQQLREAVIKRHLHRQVVEEDLPENEDSAEIQKELSNYSFEEKEVKSLSFEDEEEVDEE